MFQSREFEGKLSSLINEYSVEGMSNTPDFVLATYLMDCLRAYHTAISGRKAFESGISPRA